jgi:hypothetical protein
MTSNPEVTPEDREAAADYWRDFVAKVGECIVENSIRRGDMDGQESVLRFARHRTQAEAKSKVEIAVLVEALGKLVEDNLLRGPFDEPLGESEQSPLVNAARAILAKHSEKPDA